MGPRLVDGRVWSVTVVDQSSGCGGWVRKVAPSTICLAGLLLGCSGTEKDSAEDPPDLGGPGVDTHQPEHPPTAPVVAIVPAAPTTDDDLVFQVDTPPVDPDGDALTWFVAWFVDGVPATSWEDRVPAAETRKGQVWEVRATVTDGTYTSETGLDVVVIGNTPPVAQVTLTPERPTTLDRLSVSPSSIDPDEADAVGYSIAWQVDGVDAGLSGLDVDPSRTRKGEVWSVTVTPVDPDDTGTAVFASVTIENSLPIAEDVEIIPDDPTTNDDVEVVFSGYDPDEADTLTPQISWTVDGVEVGSDASLSSDLFRRDQELVVGVAFHDGTVAGVPAFAEPVVVKNSVPSILGAELDPAAPGPDDDVTCIPRGWSDADLDAEGYTYLWTLDGVPGPATDHWELASSSAGAGQMLTCTVVPNDGRDAGPSVTVSALLSDG